VLAGDLPPRAGDLAARTVGAWRSRGRTAPRLPLEEARCTHLHLVHREESQQANILLRGFLALKRSDPQYYAFDLLNYILGGGFSSRLNQNLRVKNGFTYSVYSQPDLRRQAALLEIGTEVRGEVLAAAIRETLAEVGRLREEGVVPEEVEGAQRFLEGTFAMRLAHQSRFAGQLLALRMEGIDPAAELAEYVRRVGAVTPRDVAAAAERLLDPGRLQIAVVGDAADLAPRLAVLGLPTEVFDTEGRPYAA
jgi:zinc protease